VHILAVHPRLDAPANRVLIDAGKGRKSPDTVLPPLVLHEPGGGFTPVADAVLRKMAPLAV
jgi:tRNA1(Val) A37 N6-methylase TrmN6